MVDPFRATKPRWFIWDGLGISCSVFTYLLIGYGEFVVVCVMLLPEIPDISWGFLHAVLFSLLVILAIAAHIRAMVTDPGSIPLGNCTENNLKKLQLKEGEVVLRCTRCQCIKLDRAHHCSTCQRCIRKMDHHCPWINNCVGETNQKFFILFTFYVMAISAYAMLLAVRKLFLCMDMDWQGCVYMSLPASILFMIFLIFEALLFGIFTLVMLCTQVNSVVTDETGIEYLKKEKIRRQTSMYQNLQEVFGGKFSISWLSPFAAPVQIRKKPFFFQDV